MFLWKSMELQYIHSNVLHGLNSYFNSLNAYGFISNYYNRNQISEDICFQQNCIMILRRLLSPYYIMFIILYVILFSSCSSHQKKHSSQCTLWKYVEKNIIFINILLAIFCLFAWFTFISSIERSKLYSHMCRHIWGW